MLDRQSRSPVAGRSETDDPSAARSPTPGKIGFVGLGHMGTAMITVVDRLLTSV